MCPRQGGTYQLTAHRPYPWIVPDFHVTVERRSYSDFVRNVFYVLKFLDSNSLSQKADIKPFLLSGDKLTMLLLNMSQFRTNVHTP